MKDSGPFEGCIRPIDSHSGWTDGKSKQTANSAQKVSREQGIWSGNKQIRRVHQLERGHRASPRNWSVNNSRASIRTCYVHILIILGCPTKLFIAVPTCHTNIHVTFLQAKTSAIVSFLRSVNNCLWSFSTISTPTCIHCNSLNYCVQMFSCLKQCRKFEHSKKFYYSKYLITIHPFAQVSYAKSRHEKFWMWKKYYERKISWTYDKSPHLHWYHKLGSTRTLSAYRVIGSNHNLLSACSQKIDK